ncbi:peptide chain release factor 2 [Thermaerobacter sp. PB12/4term]|uniref:peptide chain release factor 2 n=1 Tax=Thermaerobacter sp. PB12/4term TaxID=2293838 RepID=UPI000E32975A|nr:peptide chain release factor 2 [Thermaerobacter sp. PB12/4term]
MWDEVLRRIRALRPRLDELRDDLDLAGKRREIERIEQAMTEPGFWDDPERAQHQVRQLKVLKGPVERYEALDRKLEDLQVLAELAAEEADVSVIPELEEGIAQVEEGLRQLELELLLTGPYDGYDAIVSLHPGAGGTESQDWAQMLWRMYTRWAEDRGYQVEVLDLLEGEEAGIKSVTFAVRGPNAYGYLRSEHGVHRLVRISPFDAAGRRHTSFASVDVLPDLGDSPEIEIRPEDLRIDVFRAGGHGGQHVNKTESAVRIVHLPTGIVATCQNERSQHSNRETAMKILKARLARYYEEQRLKEIAALRGDVGEIAWGNQIRSYVFQPYTLVKDHRTGVEVGNVQAVMDGQLDVFINAYLKWEAARSGKLGARSGDGPGQVRDAAATRGQGE